MKPIRIIISVFGSYGSKTEIDFSGEQQGIFLITGDTGAGKTTIFDAITYALYGQTSGGERSGNMMRSQYAVASAETFVELTFVYREQEYKVRRNPEYQIEKTLKNGTVKMQKVASGVELTMPDGSLFPEKKAATDAKIEEILGLSVEQFTQIVMIAQGDFLKLLYTKSDERKKIFSKLFQTDKYWRIQERLKYRSIQLDNQIEENKRAYAQEQARIMIPEEFRAQFEEGEWPLEELNEKIVQVRKEVEEALANTREKEKKLSIALNGMEEVNRQFEQYERMLRQQAELEGKKEEEQLRIVRIAEAKKAEKIRGFEEKYIEAVKKEEQSANLKKKLESSIETLDEKRRLAGEQLEVQKDIYYQLLIGQQAGLLALELKDNEPCPVCGSTEHPALAIGDVKKKIGELESELNRAKTKLAKCSENLESAQEELQMRRGQLKQEEEKYKTCERNVTQAKEAYEKKLTESSFDSEEAYKQAYLPERSREKLERESREYQEKCSLISGQLVTWEKALQGKEKQDTIELKMNLREVEAEVKQLERRKMQLHTAYQTNRSILENSRNYREKGKQLSQEDQVVKSLYRTAGGKLSGSAKIDFETYIQRQYFKQIIHEANKRLLTMSGQQFMLKLKEESDVGKRSNEGLDLAVYSLVTDSERDVKTLSGGESFMAALAMALGLSDIVAKNAGGIQMDMLFIDEGFGSLDANARRNAIEVLQQLSDGKRMVGIISHVTELKEQMDHKLVVTRSDKGSKVSWEIV
ncbi:MAG: SMC family ATPase [Roseburia sp.]|nr:SMC family ATPase [Roseburia sp.]